jgi:hypothetical protein
MNEWTTRKNVKARSAKKGEEREPLAGSDADRATSRQSDLWNVTG